MKNKTRRVFSNLNFAPRLIGCVLLLLFVLTPVSTNAQCKQWDVSGAWSLEQSDHFTVYMNLRQNAKDLLGSAFYLTRGGAARDGVIVGAVRGSIVKDKYEVRVAWNDGQKQLADYAGKVDSSGRLTGTVSVGGKVAADWSTATKMRCLDGRSDSN